MIWNFHDFACLGPVLQSGSSMEPEKSFNRVVIIVTSFSSHLIFKGGHCHLTEGRLLCGFMADLSLKAGSNSEDQVSSY